MESAPPGDHGQVGANGLYQRKRPRRGFRPLQHAACFVRVCRWGPLSRTRLHSTESASRTGPRSDPLVLGDTDRAGGSSEQSLRGGATSGPRVDLPEMRRRRRGRSSSAGGGLPLTEPRAVRMVLQMRTTLSLDDGGMAELEREAARHGRTMSELVESALCDSQRPRRGRPQLPPLPNLPISPATTRMRPSRRPSCASWASARSAPASRTPAADPSSRSSIR